jgi:histidinol-phosphate aminotransferase
MSKPTLPTPKPGIMDIKPYVAGKSSIKGKQRTIKLASNENPWGPSAKAIEAFRSAEGALFRYPESAHTSFREAVASVYPVNADQLICGAGSDELIGLMIQAYAGEGDEVLFSRHAFLMYKLYTLAHSATPIMADENNLTVDVDTLLAKVNANTKLVFLANPNNPTGTYIPYSEVKRLRQGLPDHVILVLDAAYAEFMNAEDYSTGHALVENSNTVVTHTLSKIYGLPALRLGFAHAPKHIIDVLSRIRSPFNVNSPALAAGEAAILDQDYVQEMIEKNATERTRVSAHIHALGYNVIPSHTNFVLVHVGTNAADLYADLETRGIIVRDVNAYGLPEYLRISIGTNVENDALCDALSAFAEQTNQQRAKA